MCIGYMRINLGGGNIGMAEHGLNRANIGAVHEEIGGEGMAKSMRGDMFGDAGLFSVFFDNALDRASGEAAKIARGVGGLLVF